MSKIVRGTRLEIKVDGETFNPCPTIADQVRASADPYHLAVAKMEYREAPFGSDKVTFHFADGSTLTFKKEYRLED